MYDAIGNWYTVEKHNRRKYKHERYNSTEMKSLLSVRRYSDVSKIVYSMQELVLELAT